MSLRDEIHSILLVVMTTGVLACVLLDLENLKGKTLVFLTSIPRTHA